eukprot:TRINITY_DN13149_c0_g1_i2.p1 TRINITY_DN13149_c0_g1~~TRINITY_DN13149_c0_g1_i2.p1  ORF type:complete len:461 (+),score=65.56 TRINITY_DN13149_c0_g1_i2:53-1435(+)
MQPLLNQSSSSSDPAPSLQQSETSGRVLYSSYFLAAWGDRMWEFASVVFLLDIFPDTLFPASLFGLIETLAGILAGTPIGRFIDQTNRLTAVRLSVIGQNVSITLASLLFYFTLENKWHDATAWIFFFVLLFCACFAKWSSTINKICIHKDWLVVVAHGNSTLQTQLNAGMRRIDLTCSVVAPLAIGVLADIFSPAIACLCIAGWSFMSFFVELLLNSWVYAQIPELHIKKAVVVADSGAEPVPDVSLLQIFQSYYCHPVFYASVAYCFLYISCLSFGGIMVSYLKTLGVRDVWLAAGRGIAATVGVFATFIFPYVVGRKGLIWAGSFFGWLQLLCLLPLAVAFPVFRSNDQSTTFIVLIFVCICASRFGLWGFDMAETQLMQEEVALEEAGKINGAQDALMNVCYLMSFALTMIFSDPTQFFYPALISIGSVVSAVVLFQYYIIQNRKRTQLLPNKEVV